jgi:hypothetical protein
MKSRGMKWAEHVARMDEMRNAYKILVRKPEGRDHLENTGVDGRIILKFNVCLLFDSLMTLYELNRLCDYE